MVKTIKDGYWTTIGIGNYGDEDGIPDYDESGNPIYVYTWDNVTLPDKAAYDAKLSSMYDKSKAVDGYKKEELMDADTIINKINEL